MNVLLAPAHYMLDGVSGASEFGVAYHIVEALAAHPEVKLFVLTGSARSQRPFPPNVRVVRLDRAPVGDLTPLYQLGFVMRYYAAARRILSRHRIDLIHHMLPFGFTTTFNLLPLLGHTRTVPFVVGPLQMPHTVPSTEERVYVQGNVQYDRGLREQVRERITGRLLRTGRPLLNALSRHTLRHSDCLVTVNRQTQLLYAGAIPTVPSVVIPLGPLAGIAGDCADAAVPRPPRPEIEILYVGALTRRKGVDLVIAAVAQLAAQYPSLRFRIVGDGPQRPALEALAEQHGIGSRTVFEGIVASADVGDYFARSDIFVSMSYSESFGHTVIEAMLAGLPVIAAENVGSREIVDDGATGFLVPPGSTEALVARLQLLVADAAKRVALGEHARYVAQQRYKWSTIGDQYLAVYHDVLQRHAATRVGP